MTIAPSEDERAQATGAEEHQSYPRPRTGPYQEVMGYELLRLADGRPAVRLQVEERHLNQFGIGHGGVALAMLDVAGGLAVWDLCKPTKGMATVSMNTAFLDAVHLGPIYAIGRVERAGGTLAYTYMTLHAQEPDGKLLGSAQGIYRIFRGESPEGESSQDQSARDQSH